jgi:hypothetical protein
MLEEKRLSSTIKSKYKEIDYWEFSIQKAFNIPNYGYPYVFDIYFYGGTADGKKSSLNLFIKGIYYSNLSHYHQSDIYGDSFGIIAHTKYNIEETIVFKLTIATSIFNAAKKAEKKAIDVLLQFKGQLGGIIEI